MNKELILMLVLSFVVGYIVSEVVRKCGCDIEEGLQERQIDAQGGDDLVDPNNNTVPVSMSDRSCNIDPPTNYTCNNWHISKPDHRTNMCHWSCKDNDNKIRCAEYYTNDARSTVSCWEN